jgi:hypothetical protein
MIEFYATQYAPFPRGISRPAIVGVSLSVCRTPPAQNRTCGFPAYGSTSGNDGSTTRMQSNDWYTYVGAVPDARRPLTWAHSGGGAIPAGVLEQSAPSSQRCFRRLRLRRKGSEPPPAVVTPAPLTTCRREPQEYRAPPSLQQWPRSDSAPAACSSLISSATAVICCSRNSIAGRSAKRVHNWACVSSYSCPKSRGAKSQARSGCRWACHWPGGLRAPPCSFPCR